MIIFFYLAIFSASLALINIGGEELGKINYWPIACFIVTIIFFLIGTSYTKSSFKQ